MSLSILSGEMDTSVCVKDVLNFFIGNVVLSVIDVDGRQVDSIGEVTLIRNPGLVSRMRLRRHLFGVDVISGWAVSCEEDGQGASGSQSGDSSVVDSVIVMESSSSVASLLETFASFLFRPAFPKEK